MSCLAYCMTCGRLVYTTKGPPVSFERQCDYYPVVHKDRARHEACGSVVDLGDPADPDAAALCAACGLLPPDATIVTEWCTGHKRAIK